MGKKEPTFWVFSNKPAGSYQGNIWDHGTTIRTKRHYFREDEKNRRKVKPSDVGILRIFGAGYIGRFEVGKWNGGDVWKKGRRTLKIGYFKMKKLTIWKRELPQQLIIRDLSNKDVRSRLIRIASEDALKIDTAQRVYERLGFGSADGEVILLEKGLEEAIKPNLPQLGLKPANKDIAQQFSMGPGAGRSDLICEDANGNLVVLELKRDRSSSEVIGQVMTYVGYLRENVAKKGQKVHGWVIVGDYDENLRLAASAAGIRLLTVRLP